VTFPSDDGGGLDCEGGLDCGKGPEGQWTQSLPGGMREKGQRGGVEAEP
jgi:hypothetical protein